MTPSERAAPPGTIRTTVTFLEMTERPAARHRVAPPGKVAILHAEEPPAHFYRYLYRAIGRDYNWSIRWHLNDEELLARIRAVGVEIYVLYANGVPAGLCEFDFAHMPLVQVLYFGITPEFLGRGYGRFFLDQMLELAWDRGPERIRLNTCTLDHPRALPMYQRFGFAPYAQEEQDLPLLRV
ncbi:MAG: GNAT family N-acetyltransferase [Alphaproteobacteria bacterium]|nr:GNAT family N-acetyltransferase [Alphaproteobacteria bacterium]